MKILKIDTTDSAAAPSVSQHAERARMSANALAYWRDPGLIIRLASTVVRTLFGASVTYSAVVGLLPTAVNWADDLGPSDVSWLASQGTQSWNEVFAILHQLHVVGLAFAVVVGLLILVAEILLPRRKKIAFAANPISSARHAALAESALSDAEVDQLEAECAEEREHYFKIAHRYDIGDQAVYLARGTSEIDIRRAAAYIVVMAEEWFGNVLVSNLGVAAALVQCYGFHHSAKTSICNDIDLYEIVSAVGYSSVKGDPRLRREGLREAITPHVSRAG